MWNLKHPDNAQRICTRKTSFVNAPKPAGGPAGPLCGVQVQIRHTLLGLVYPHLLGMLTGMIPRSLTHAPDALGTREGRTTRTVPGPQLSTSKIGMITPFLQVR